MRRGKVVCEGEKLIKRGGGDTVALTYPARGAQTKKKNRKKASGWGGGGGGGGELKITISLNPRSDAKLKKWRSMKVYMRMMAVSFCSGVDIRRPREEKNKKTCSSGTGKKKKLKGKRTRRKSCSAKKEEDGRIGLSEQHSGKRTESTVGGKTRTKN